jgi:methylglyoxal/glyoxal reductase
MAYTDSVTLQNGVKMPLLGLGVWQSKEGGDVESAVETALRVGYRSIDTATIYGNEAGVQQGIAASGVARGELFITTKVWNRDQGYDEALRAFEASCQRLKVDYLDLYLIHWPVVDKFTDTWRALERLYEEKLIRVIGVSNFKSHHLEKLSTTANIAPMVNQVEFHPYLTQVELQQYCVEQQIQLEAWSPLMQGHFLQEPVITELAEKYGRTPAQIVLRWDLQHGVVTIPKSITASRIEENAQIWDFELETVDVERLDALNRDQRYGQDPDNFNF